MVDLSLPATDDSFGWVGGAPTGHRCHLSRAHTHTQTHAQDRIQSSSRDKASALLSPDRWWIVPWLALSFSPASLAVLVQPRPYRCDYRCDIVYQCAGTSPRLHRLVSILPGFVPRDGVPPTCSHILSTL